MGAVGAPPRVPTSASSSPGPLSWRGTEDSASPGTGRRASPDSKSDHPALRSGPLSNRPGTSGEISQPIEEIGEIRRVLQRPRGAPPIQQVLAGLAKAQPGLLPLNGKGEEGIGLAGLLPSLKRRDAAVQRGGAAEAVAFDVQVEPGAPEELDCSLGLAGHPQVIEDRAAPEAHPALGQ